MARTGFSVSVELEGARETLAAFRRLPKEASNTLRDRSTALAQVLAGSARRAAGAAPTPQAALAASSVKVRRDRMPSIVVGGSGRVGRNSVPLYKVLFGAEFGSNTLPQFHHAHTGRRGIWFFPTAERESSDIARAWQKVADDIVRDFTRGGGV